MLWLLVPNHLPQVAHVDLLSARRAGIEVVVLIGWFAAVLLAGNGWSTSDGLVMAVKQSIRLKCSGTILAHAKLKRSLAGQFMRLKFIRPMFPTLVEVPPTGDNWIHEIKYDGYRTQIIIETARPERSREEATTGHRRTRR
ncbi:hypothetical protein [Mesorhizobium sp. M7A.F.Ca.CA.001.16.1.1]|uniref:hypothetical protein n=1 Tax=Mesorhizobium sp. M7A.F.Ca.CA.001.16.1.1 TaxID=2496683 RepID=UPI0032AEB236